MPTLISCLVCVVCCKMSVLAFSPPISNKAILVDTISRMWMGVDLKLYVDEADTTPIPILRHRSQEKEFDTDTGIFLLLPDTCTHPECVESLCNGESTDEQTNKFVLSKTEDSVWKVSCQLFDNVELPSSITGTPEQRSLDGDDRTRGQAATIPPQESATPVITPSIQGFGSEPPVLEHDQTDSGLIIVSNSQGPVSTTTQAPTLNKVFCDSLFTTNAESFFTTCCMKSSAAESDPRCVLKTLLQVMESQQNKAVSATATSRPTTISTTIKKISDGFGVTEADVYQEEFDSSNTTAKTAPAEEYFSPSESEKVVWSLTGQISSWRSKYFTVLGFFLVFLVFFLLILAALIYKLRAAKAASPPTSPGAGCGGPGRYDASCQGDGERAPLTPATQQAQTFQY